MVYLISSKATMKQKMVVRVSMNSKKSRSKAMEIAVSFLVVESASLKSDNKSQIELTGDGVDPVQLIKMLRKRVGHAELERVDAVKNEPSPLPPPPPLPQPIWPPCPPPDGWILVPSYGYAQPCYEPPCSIL